MRVLFRIVLWNVAFAVTLLVVVFIFAVWVEHYFPTTGRNVADVIGLSVFGVLGLWVLFLGSKYATRRGAVIACAVGAAGLGLLQLALLAFLRAWSQSFGGRTTLTTTLELLLAVVLVIGVTAVWVFVHAKRAARP